MRQAPASSRQHACDRGSVLPVASFALLVLLAVGLALAGGAMLESAIASNHRDRLSARYAAESGLDLAMADLARIADWDAVLTGLVRGGFCDGLPGGTRSLPRGGAIDLDGLRNQANCGHQAACTPADLVRITAERPWGVNNPVWTLFAYGPVDALQPAGSPASPVYLAVFVADDGGEDDGNPYRDGDAAAGPGTGRLWLRAVAVGPGPTRHAVQAAVAREAPGSGPAWGHLRVLARGAAR